MESGKINVDKPSKLGNWSIKLVLICFLLNVVLICLCTHVLQRIPSGEWQCPTCRPKSDSREETNVSDLISKRESVKVTLGKSEIGTKPVGTDRVPECCGSDIRGKKRSSGKGKSSSSLPKQSIEDKRESSVINEFPSVTPCRPSQDGSGEGSSSILKVDENKHKTKSVSLAEGVVSQSSIADSEKVEKASEKSSNFSLNNGSSTEVLVPVLDADIPNSRKRKRKVYVDEDEKECAATTSKKRGSKTACASSQSSIPRHKSKKLKHGGSHSEKDEVLLVSLLPPFSV